MTTTIFLQGVIVGLAKHSEMIDGVRVMGALCPEAICAHVPADVLGCDRMNEAQTIPISKQKFIGLALTKEEASKPAYTTWTLATAAKTSDYNIAANWQRDAARFIGSLATTPFENIVFWSNEKQVATVMRLRDEQARKAVVDETLVKQAFVTVKSYTPVRAETSSLAVAVRQMLLDTQTFSSIAFDTQVTLARLYGKSATVFNTYVDPFSVEAALSTPKVDFDAQIEELRKNPLIFGIELVRSGIRIYTNMLAIDIGTGCIELGKFALTLNLEKLLVVNAILTDNPNIIESNKFQPIANQAYAQVAKVADQSIFESKMHMAWRAASAGCVELQALESSVTFGPYSGKIYSKLGQGDIKTAIESMLQVLVLNNPTVDLPSFGYKHKA